MALIEDEKKKAQSFNRAYNAATDDPMNVSRSRQANPVTAPGLVGTIAGGLNSAGFKNTAAAVTGSAEDTQRAYQQGGIGAGIGMAARTAITPAMGLVSDVLGGAKPILDPAANALKTFATGNAAPASGQTAAQLPANPSLTPSIARATTPAGPVPLGNEGRVTRSNINPAGGGMTQQSAFGENSYDIAKTSQPGISKITGNGLSSPLYTNLTNANQAVEGLKQQGIGSGVAAAGQGGAMNQAAGSIDAGMPEGLARYARANAIRQQMIDAQPRGGFAVMGGLDGQGRTQQQRENDEKTARWRQDELADQAKYRPQMAGIAGEAIRGDSQQATEGMRQQGIAGGLNVQRRGQDMNYNAQMSQQGLAARAQEQNAAMGNARLGMDGERLGMDRAKFGMEQSNSLRQQAARDALGKAMASGDERAINQARSMAMAAGVNLGNENMRDNFMAVGGGQEWDAAANTMRNVPQRLVDLRTGQEVGGGKQGASLPIDQNPQAAAIKSNASMTREQKVAALRELGYS